MNYRRLPGTDLDVSVMTFGTWVAGGDAMWGGADDDEIVRAMVLAVEDCGVNFIDTAPVYGDGHSEELVGRALRELKGCRVLVATKCGLVRRGVRITNDLTPDSVRREVDDSLRRLGVDRIDLYQCHWPDPKTPLVDTMGALVDLASRGKIRHIGVSNFNLDLLKSARALAPVVSVQSQYSLLERGLEKSVLPYCTSDKVGFLAYGPLGGGALTGKYKQQPNFPKSDARNFFYPYFRPPYWQKLQTALESVAPLCAAKNVSCGALALAWVASRPGVTSVIAGCRTAEQALQNARAFDVFLSSEDMAFLSRAFEPVFA